MFTQELDWFNDSKVADLSLWGNESAASSRSCSAVIAAVISSTLGTRREREVEFLLSFCILRNDWENSFENFDLIQEELDKGLLFANCFQSISRTRLRKCNLLTDLIRFNEGPEQDN
jgi:hypothetical protein